MTPQPPAASDPSLLAIGPHRTVEQVVVAKLREAIITGSLKPGDRLAYRDLAQRLGVSVTPVRMAVRELANEGLVELRAHAGARVSPLSIDEVEEIFATRIGVEGWLARHGATRLTPSEIDDLAGHFESLKQAEAKEEVESYMDASWSMRVTCYRRAGKPRLFDRFRALYEHSRRYVYLLMADPSRLEQSRRDMEEFFLACKDRDGVAAQEAIQHALMTTLSYLSNAFERSESGAP